MLSFDSTQVYLACGVTDMRKSINGLMAIVEGSFQLDPFSEALSILLGAAKVELKLRRNEVHERRVI